MAAPDVVMAFSRRTLFLIVGIGVDLYISVYSVQKQTFSFEYVYQLFLRIRLKTLTYDIRNYNFL